ncbi:MAG: PorV/PorQ family protein [Elusimicrobia bacterium]|nr:PorV/PorQ family protein [Elusimicrobiota bacterium]
MAAGRPGRGVRRGRLSPGVRGRARRGDAAPPGARLAGLTFLLAAAALALPSVVRAGLLPPGAFSSSAVGTTGASFLKNPFGARAAAMGGAVAASAQGAEALFQNPAALARFRPGSPAEAALGYDALLETAYQGSMAYARPLGEQGALGVGLVYASQSPQTAYDSQGNAAGRFTPLDLAAGAGLARRVGAWDVGAAFKLIHSALSDRRADGAAVDLGVVAPDASDLAGAPVDFGAALLNLGPRLKLGSAADPLPLSARAGLSWRASPSFEAALDAVFPVDDAAYVAVGVERRFLVGPAGSVLPWTAALRAGYDSARSTGIEGFSGGSFGLGLDFAALRVDYAWVPFGDVGDSHRLTFAVRF